MGQTFFDNFTRDNGLPVTVEYSCSGGEPNHDHPGHICDGGGSGPEVVIVKAWPNMPGFERLCKIRNDLDWTARPSWLDPFIWIALQVVDLRIWLQERRALLSVSERERMENWIAEHHVYDDPYEPEDNY